ncbi:unannotated protein [freshwater metagenome]|uniref:Unannotated protein n=1 Tax=freshwater metagenome TaxID=449393 RepID=A0A6J7CY03_9ZZZZ
MATRDASARDSSLREPGQRDVGAGTLTDEVYQGLREAIVRGEYRPNERLIEAELAERLQVSRTPIREVLQRLATDGLVQSRRRGWVVTEHSPEEIHEIYEIRLVLEGYAARLAATHADDAALAAIATLHADNVAGLRQGARDRLVSYNDAFHDAIIAAAGNKRLAQQIRQNSEYYFNFRIAALYSDEEAESSLAGHQAMVDALSKRDPDAAEQAARAHVAEAWSVMMSKLR